MEWRTTEWPSCFGGRSGRDGVEGEDCDNEDNKEEENSLSSEECDIICR